jgi:competence protein ComFC
VFVVSIAMAASFKKTADTLVGFIYPNVCQLCGAQRATSSDGFICARCWEQVRFIRPPFCRRCGLPFQGALTTEFECSNCRDLKLHFSSARSAVILNKTVLEVVRRYKYKRALWFEPFLADLLIREALPELRKEKWDFIVPVPLHPDKKRQREFNQAERLATFLSAAASIPMDTTLLKRVAWTETQTKLSREKRAENMRNAFTMRKKRKLRGERIVLFDDVFTTGATTNACAEVLLAAGAGEVGVWTIARGL